MQSLKRGKVKQLNSLCKALSDAEEENCSQETQVSSTDTVGCERILKLSHSPAIKASVVDTFRQTSVFADYTVILSS